MDKEVIDKILREFRTTDIPRYDKDDSKANIRSRTYCGISSDDKEQIYKWLRQKLLGEKLIENLS